MTDNIPVPVPVPTSDKAEPEAPYVYAVKVPALDLIVTIRAQTATELWNRVAALLGGDTGDNLIALTDQFLKRVGDIRFPDGAPDRAEETTHPARGRRSSEGNADEQPAQPTGRRTRSSRGRRSSEGNAEDSKPDSGTFDAVRITVFFNEKLQKYGLGFWDHKRKDNKYPPVTFYYDDGKYPYRLFTENELNLRYDDFFEEGILLEDFDNPVKVHYQTNESGGKTYVNPKKIEL